MKRTTISQIAIIAAVLAAFFAALWVWSYIEVTSIDPPYEAPIALKEYVYGQEYGIEGPATELLFVVVTRFLVGFGFTWAPCTVGLMVVNTFRPARREM